jgi:hypothetical protein
MSAIRALIVEDWGPKFPGIGCAAAPNICVHSVHNLLHVTHFGV